MMNRLLPIAAAWLLVAHNSPAQEIDSPVIHNYRYVALGYGYLNNFPGTDVDAHGGVAALSFELENLLLGVGGGYFWGEEGVVDLNVWTVTANLGHVFRLVNNRFNLIPNVGVSYGEAEVDVGSAFSDSANSWSVFPGIGASFALNDRIAINGSYAWGYNLETEEDDHFYSAGAKFAVAERIGLGVNATFSNEIGWSGITASVEFHYKPRLPRI